MNRYSFAFVTLAIIATPGYGVDTFASRLSGVKYVGLSVDEQLSAFTIHIYTREKYREYVASTEQFHRERAAFDEARPDYDRKLREAKERHASPAELNAIMMKRHREQSELPGLLLDKRIKLHTVVTAGDDYISVSPLGKPTQEILIPFSRVGRVIFVTSAEPSAASTGLE